MSKNSLRIAVIQLNAGPDFLKNQTQTEKLIAKACKKKIDIIFLPETFLCRNPSRSLSVIGESIPGLATHWLSKLCKQYKVWIQAGSVSEKNIRSSKVWNAALLFDRRGNIKAHYRKMHLFDAQVGKKGIQESLTCHRGKKPVLGSVEGHLIGLSICYDLRFPELYRYYSKKGASLLCVPSSFTRETGQDHWKALLRARAIENQCFVVAANQYGKGTGGVVTYGHSLVIDPWGQILAEAGGQKAQILYTTLDFNLIKRVRNKLPALKHRVKIA